MDKALGKDQRAEERILPLFVMAASMLMAIILLSTYSAAMIARNLPTGYWEQPGGYEMIGDVEYSYLDPIDGYAVYPNDHTNDVRDDTHKFEFNYSDWAYFTARLIRDVDRDDWLANPFDDLKYDDMVLLHIKKKDSWSAPDKWVQISYGTLTQRFTLNNLSYAYFTAFKTNFTVLLKTDTNGTDHSDHIHAVWAGVYTISIAVSTDALNTIAMDTSMWAVLGQLLTLSLPDVSLVVNILLAAPVAAALGFMVFTILSRVIPFISGG